MAKFYGVVGFGFSIETTLGVWEDSLVEYKYFGDILRNTRKLEEGQGLNKDITTSNSISIVADAYAREHFFAIRYVEWAGALWTVSDVEVQSPRLLLRLGGAYNGPRAKEVTPAVDSGESAG